MKRTLIRMVIGLMLGMLLCAASALAETGDTMFFMIGENGFINPSNAAAIGNMGFIMTLDNGRETIYRIRAGEMQPEGFLLEKISDDPMDYGTFLLFGYGEELMGLNARSGRVYQIELTNGTAILTERLQLDWKDMDAGYDESGSVPRELGKYVVSGDTLYLTVYEEGSWNRMDLIAYSLKDGSRRIVSRKDVIFSIHHPGAFGDLAAYRDGRLLTALPDEKDWEAVWRLCEISTEGGSVKEITKLSGVGVGGLVYDEAQDRVVYLCGGMICATDLNGNHAELASSPVGAPNPEQCYGGAALLKGGYYFVSRYEGSAVRNIGSAGQLRTLTIAGERAQSDAAFLAFSEAHPEAAIRYREERLNPEEIVQAMMSASSEIDIYYLNTSNEAFRALTRRGYAADLSQSKTLMGLTERMFPVFQNALVKDERLVAFPKSVNAYSLTISLPAAETIGLEREEWPGTWEELLDLIERWEEEYSKEFPEISLLDPYQLADLKGTLLNELMRAQAVSMNQNGGQTSIDSPFMRNMLEQLDSMNFAAFETERDFSRGFLYDPEKVLLNVGWPDMPQDLYREEGKGALLPARSEGEKPMIGVDMYVYIINPYSKNMDLAIEYLETRAETMEEGLQATLCADWREPIRDPDAENELKLCEKRIAEKKEALGTAADDQKQALENTIRRMEDWKQAILTRGDLWTEEQLAEYRELTDHFVLIENWYFSGSGSTEIQQIIARYLDGELSSDQMLSALDQKLRMMQMEEGY